MADALFYAEVIPAVGAVAVVEGDEGFHAATVRRIRPGERLVLSDGAGVLAECVVEAADKRRISARVLDRRRAPKPAPVITVVQAIPKSERSELAIELARWRREIADGVHIMPLGLDAAVPEIVREAGLR